MSAVGHLVAPHMSACEDKAGVAITPRMSAYDPFGTKYLPQGPPRKSSVKYGKDSSTIGTTVENRLMAYRVSCAHAVTSGHLRATIVELLHARESIAKR